MLRPIFTILTFLFYFTPSSTWGEIDFSPLKRVLYFHLMGIDPSGCQRVSVIKDKLGLWEKKISFTSSIFKDSGCEVDISAHVPSSMINLFNVKQGPICYTLPLFMNGLISEPLIVFDEEFKFWLDSSGLCQRIPPGNELVVGDVGVVGFSSSEYFDHTFFYIAPELSLDTNAIVTWQGRATDKILKEYGVELRPEDLLVSPKHKQVAFYRCEGLKTSRWKKVHEFVPEEFKKFEEWLVGYERVVSENLRLSTSEKEKAAILLSEVSQLIKKQTPSERDMLLNNYLTYLKFRIARVRWFINN